MAYGEKYYHEYCDRHGDTYRISLQEEGYTGLSTEVECGYEQFLIEQESSEVLLIGGVRPTRATATFVSSGAFDLQEIYTGTERTYLLVRYKNGNLNWQGNVPSEGFSQSNWDAKHIQLTVKATDNLSGLKSEPFTDAVGENYGNDGNNIQTFLWAIKDGLKKTGFNMNIWSFVDLKPMFQSGENVYSVKIERISSNQVRLYFPNSGIYNKFVSSTSNGDTVRITTISLKGTITSYTHSYNWLIKYATLTLDVNVPTFNKQDSTVYVSPPPMTLGSIVDPLYHTQHDVRVWIRDSDIEGKTYYEARGGAMDTWSVLDAIARQWHLRIYQNNGHWEVKRINADKLDLSEHQWFVYNSEGTFLRREGFASPLLIPCVPTDYKYRIFGTTLSMDRVLKNVIVNYRYKYKQDGDSLKNLITNGNFANGLNGWVVKNNPDINKFVPATASVGSSVSLPGISNYASISNIVTGKYLASREVWNGSADEKSSINKGDSINLEWWERIQLIGSLIHYYSGDKMGVYQINIWNAKESINVTEEYSLVADKIPSPVTKVIDGQTILEQTITCRWVKVENGRYHKLITYFNTNNTTEPIGTWRKIKLEIPEVPINGYLVFESEGVGRAVNADAFFQTVNITSSSYNFGTAPNEIRNNSTFYTFQINSGSSEFKAVFATVGNTMTNTYQPNYFLQITGVQLNKIVDPSNEIVPQIDPFMYPDQQAQLAREFSDTIKEIEVLTGDDYGQYQEDRISGMLWGDIPTQFWDTWDDRFGWSRQGLVLAKSIIENYWKPTRLIECEIGIKDFNWSSLIEFEELPGLRFTVIRGAIGGVDSTFKGTLKEIHGELEEFLPPGGQDGGNTTAPNWQPTGVVRCVKDDNTGLNTGMAEMVETDINQASPTYGQERWVDAGEDLTTCPIGEPLEILWGEQLVLDVDNLRSYPYGKIDDTYSVDYSNDGSDRYLRLVHRSDLGVVRSITYSGGFENLSGWEYESDVVIDGYTYKSMKLTWFVGVFTNLNVNFVIN